MLYAFLYCLEIVIPPNVNNNPKYFNINININPKKNNGILIVSRKRDMKYEQMVPYESLDKDKEYKVYKFTIQNKLKMKREYEIFYKIINPQK